MIPGDGSTGGAGTGPGGGSGSGSGSGNTGGGAGTGPKLAASTLLFRVGIGAPSLDTAAPRTTR